MQRVKYLANKIPFLVDLTLLLLSNCDFGVRQLYPGKFDLIDHGILFVFFIIGNIALFA